MKRFLVVAAAALALAPPALAAPPTLLSVGHVRGHPSAQWTLPPGAEARVIELATSPITGTDGYFFQENVELFDTLEPSQTTYTSSQRIDPGTYYVHVASFDRNCLECPVREWSNVLVLQIPNTTPTLRVDRLRFTYGIDARLTICDPEGGDVAILVTLRIFQGRRVVRRFVRSEDGHVFPGSSGCDRESVYLSVPSSWLRRGRTYVVTFQVRDRHRARSNVVTRRGRFR